MTPQEIEALRSEALKDKVDALSDMVDILKAERDTLAARVEELEMCLKERKAVCHQAFDANEALKAERDELKAQVEYLKSHFNELIEIAQRCDSWESFPQKPLDKALAALQSLPQQCLSEIKAEAIEAAICYCNLYADDVLAVSELKQYTESVRQGGAE